MFDSVMKLDKQQENQMTESTTSIDARHKGLEVARDLHQASLVPISELLSNADKIARYLEDGTLPDA